jgi:Holliday junction resolvasome RuvABC endonuclease subunit
MTCILGIDPGASGAFAVYFTDHPERVSVEDMPVVAGEVDAATLAKRIAAMAPDLAFVERVHAMPKQGVSSTFAFGRAYGVVLGVIGAAAIPLHLVTPGKWKAHMRLSSDKEQARALALRLFPACSDHFKRKKDHGRAEAALICRYGAEVLHLFGGAA